jgi:hypothetical protein
MKFELNREYPELDNPSVFQQMVDVTLAHMKPANGRFHRAQHAKATGVVTAEFRIANDIRSDLRHGIFRKPGSTFDAFVRFSNSQGTFEKDGLGTARGLAIKLLDVTGTRAVPNDEDTTQDFLMMDHPNLPLPKSKGLLGDYEPEKCSADWRFAGGGPYGVIIPLPERIESTNRRINGSLVPNPCAHNVIPCDCLIRGNRWSNAPNVRFVS